MTGYLQNAATNASFGAVAGAMAYGAGTYASQGVTIAGNYVSVITKLLPTTNAIGGYVAQLGQGWAGAGVAAGLVGGAVAARQVFHDVFKYLGKQISEKLPENLQKNWYAQRAGTFALYVGASATAVAATLAVASAFGVAMTTTAIVFAASGPALKFIGDAYAVLKDTGSFLNAKKNDLLADLAKTKTKANVEATEVKLYGTRLASKNKLDEETDALTNEKAVDGTTDQRKKDIDVRLAAIKVEIKTLEESKDAKVIGLTGQIENVIGELKVKLQHLKDSVLEKALTPTLIAFEKALKTGAAAGNDLSDFEGVDASGVKEINDFKTTIIDLNEKIAKALEALNTPDTGLKAVHARAEAAKQKAEKALEATWIPGDK